VTHKITFLNTSSSEGELIVMNMGMGEAWCHSRVCPCVACIEAASLARWSRAETTVWAYSVSWVSVDWPCSWNCAVLCWL